ncbi:FAD/NAD(P)-binding domain-containing protein [Lindgomyces ingoldianus]|uniref:FAD/NAD(P)-binding domain-containing protein n=1 Tax=Lindgomyces ingoldianus TaxID=673940 RepID=A0ACB6QSX3_9PLEO|nr:FAD/NAD(P)-binding domain-containing protein [Lindgomyces ingoldianus]KAF2469980.1 FAD/NAD(P)-binding domain-containing protein [Lindgomyces ingoldianus]
MPLNHAIIIGGGIAGAASALALTKCNDMTCSVFEIRSEPATIGGAINLTPNALRYLEYLGVLSRLKPKGCEVRFIDIISHRTGQSLGKLNFDNLPKFKHRAIRVVRNDLLQCMLETLREAGVEVQYGMRIDSVEEREQKIAATFENGTRIEGDILLGCDGVHSAIRRKFIQPDRIAEYTGVATAYGLLDATRLDNPVRIESSSLFSGQHGSAILSYTNLEKSRLFFAAAMAAEDLGSKEGWVLRGHDQEVLKEDLLRRFSSPAVPFLAEIIGITEHLTLYPVHRLSPNGVWSSGRVLLLGDAAHAMPPQGESAGFALEDAILLSRILEHHQSKSIAELFDRYEQLRRPRINAAVKEANLRFETIRDRGWLTTIIVEWMTWAFLSWTASRKEQEFAYDVRDLDLKF